MEEYQIVVSSQLGPREGRLILERHGEKVTGLFSLLGWENPVSGQYKQWSRLVLRHPLRTAVSNLECQSILEVEGARLKGAVCTEKGLMELTGERVAPDRMPDEGETSHE